MMFILYPLQICYGYIFSVGTSAAKSLGISRGLIRQNFY